MEDNFKEGIFLGMRMKSDEVIIGTPQGVVKARTVRRRPEEGAVGWRGSKESARNPSEPNTRFQQHTHPIHDGRKGEKGGPIGRGHETA